MQDFYNYLSSDLKLESDFEEAENVTWGPPQKSGSVWSHLSPSSVIRFCFFFVKKSRPPEFSTFIIIGGFGSAWSFDPERFRQKSFDFRHCLELFLVYSDIHGIRLLYAINITIKNIRKQHRK